MIQLIAIISVFIVGYLIVDILFPEKTKLNKVFLGYPVSIGIITLSMFTLNIFKFTYNRVHIFLILIILILVLSFIRAVLKKIDSIKSLGTKLKINWISHFKNLNILEKISLSIILFLVVSSLIAVLYWPVRTWDALTLYDFRARLFVQTGVMDDLLINRYYLGHGMMISLAHTFNYLMGIGNPLYIYWLFYVSLIFSFYYILIENNSRMKSILLTLMLASSYYIYSHSTVSYSNLPYAIYISLGFIFLYIGVINKKLKYFIFSALLVGLSTWVRETEPFWILAIFIALGFSFYFRKIIYGLIYSVFMLTIRYPWVTYRLSKLRMLGSEAQDTNYIESIAKSSIQLSKVLDVVGFVNEYVMSFYGLLILSVLFLLGMILKKIEVKNLLLVIILFGNIAMIYAGVYITSLSYDKWLYVGDSITRMSMYLAPLSLFTISELLKNKNLN